MSAFVGWISRESLSVEIGGNGLEESLRSLSTTPWYGIVRDPSDGTSAIGIAIENDVGHTASTPDWKLIRGSLGPDDTPLTWLLANQVLNVSTKACILHITSRKLESIKRNPFSSPLSIHHNLIGVPVGQVSKYLEGEGLPCHTGNDGQRFVEHIAEKEAHFSETTFTNFLFELMNTQSSLNCSFVDLDGTKVTLFRSLDQAGRKTDRSNCYFTQSATTIYFASQKDALCVMSPNTEITPLQQNQLVVKTI